MMEDRFNQWCDEWTARIAARHPDDLSLEESLRLQEHAATCPDCAAALHQFLSCQALLQDYPFEDLFLAEHADTIHADGIVPAALEHLWKAQNSPGANGSRSSEPLPSSRKAVGRSKGKPTPLAAGPSRPRKAEGIRWGVRGLAAMILHQKGWVVGIGAAAGFLVLGFVFLPSLISYGLPALLEDRSSWFSALIPLLAVYLLQLLTKQEKRKMTTRTTKRKSVHRGPRKKRISQ